jgi:predicted nucleic acid-binding protein
MPVFSDQGLNTCADAYSCYLANRKQQPTPATPKTPLPDFFIGAHASLLNLPLATADAGPGRYRTYFPEVELLSPPESDSL